MKRIEFLEEKRAKWTKLLNSQPWPIEFEICAREKIKILTEEIRKEIEIYDALRTTDLKKE